MPVSFGVYAKLMLELLKFCDKAGDYVLFCCFENTVQHNAMYALRVSF